MRNVLIGAIGGFILASLFFSPSFRTPAGDQPNPPPELVEYSRVVAEASANQLAAIEFSGTRMHGIRKDGTRFSSIAPSGDVPPALTEQLISKGVVITVAQPEDSEWILAVLVNWLPLLAILGGLWLFFARPIRMALLAIEKRTSTNSTP